MSVATAVAVNAAMKIGSVSVSKIKQALSSGRNINSLADLSRPARVEPMVIVDKSLADQPFMTDLMKYGLTTFTGYYLQAVSAILNVGRIDTLKTLDALNPNRSTGGDTRNLKEAVFAAESYAHGLPAMEAFSEQIEPNLIVSLEASSDGQKLSVDDETVKKFYEIDNLAVGKLVNVEIRDGEHSAKLPILIRLVPANVPSKTLTHIFTATSRNANLMERYHMWRAGQISFVRDLMFSVDLIDEHRKALINDTSNVYMTMNSRRRNNSMKAMSSGTPSMADASNIAVISKETAKDMGRAMYGKLSSKDVRQRIFDSSYLLLLMVVDEQWERVTVYHRGIDEPTEISFREIKSSEKGKGPDITEILKAYQLGSSPTI